MTDLLIANAWRLAADDLGITVVAPFMISDSGKDYWFCVYVAHFGGPKGSVAGTAEDATKGIRDQLGYFVSNLGRNYRTYNRRLFIDTLNDWGWFGEKDKEPSWYTGQPWS